ncbi:XRE family transcriptional regulator [uncultured Roseibium sp.]|uniref:helix-turn-helix domain-containing protein n=1 Tax=uncultured Roseibium sp. TaxID=1936171 RepID=UPI002631189A|nr:XRE family transcriptional regulator [uncultured Roseibium sp.]
MTEKKIQIKLRDVRQNAGLSLSQTAELTGVSKAMLHQIERGDSSPTIATLWKLAKGFHLPLTAFIDDLIPPKETFTPAQGDLIRFPGSVGFHTIFPFDPVFGSETFLVTLEAGQTHTSNPHDAGVVEDVYVTKGEMEVLSEGQWKRCRRGDGIRFRADQPHGYRNPTNELTQFHNTLHYPKTTPPGPGSEK